MTQYRYMTTAQKVKHNLCAFTGLSIVLFFAWLLAEALTGQ